VGTIIAMVVSASQPEGSSFSLESSAPRSAFYRFSCWDFPPGLPPLQAVPIRKIMPFVAPAYNMGAAAELAIRFLLGFDCYYSRRPTFVLVLLGRVWRNAPPGELSAARTSLCNLQSSILCEFRHVWKKPHRHRQAWWICQDRQPDRNLQAISGGGEDFDSGKNNGVLKSDGRLTSHHNTMLFRAFACGTHTAVGGRR